MLPTFLVIGAMKCGTTSLYYYLAEHPEIGMSRRKETNFFVETHNWQQGRDWYAQQFPDESPERGECSPNYTKRHLYDGVPERIQAVCPNAKLVYLVRDPIERTVSHYVSNCRQRREDRSFETAVADVENSKYVLTSRYYWQLQPYLDRFAEENLLMLSTEELKNAPTATLQTVYRFLGVDPTVQNQRAGRRFNSAAKKKLGPWLRWLSRQVPQHIKDRFRPYLPLHWLPGERVSRPDIPPDLRTRLEEALQPDAEALRSLTGGDFEEWSV